MADLLESQAVTNNFKMFPKTHSLFAYCGEVLKQTATDLKFKIRVQTEAVDPHHLRLELSGSKTKHDRNNSFRCRVEENIIL